jgi:antitoxin VapB
MTHASNAGENRKPARRRAGDLAPTVKQPAAVEHEDAATAKLFMHGRSQAVRLPKAFRLPGREVRVTRFGDGVLLQPLKFDVDAWLARLDSYRDIPFMEEGREQPEMPDDDGLSFD